MANLLLWVVLLSVVIAFVIVLLLRKRKFVWAIILFVIVALVWYGYKEYTRTNQDLTQVKPNARISASDLVKEFEINDSAANKKYLGKIIESEGIVKELKKDESGYYTLVLGDTSSLSSVRCSLDTNHQQDASLLKQGMSVTIRGACTGFIKDDFGLGSDVILNRCVLVSLNERK